MNSSSTCLRELYLERQRLEEELSKLHTRIREERKTVGVSPVEFLFEIEILSDSDLDILAKIKERVLNTPMESRSAAYIAKEIYNRCGICLSDAIWISQYWIS